MCDVYGSQGYYLMLNSYNDMVFGCIETVEFNIENLTF